PAKLSDLWPSSQIFLCGLMDFTRFSFPAFREISPEDRHSLIKQNFQLIESLDGSYRAHHNFPIDDSVMASYITFVSEDSIINFLEEESPIETCKEELVQKFRKQIRRTANVAKESILKSEPLD
ncbi:hypothetical protein PENTCL1PPCAC_3746, partial [Pristionchus entomophagus]